MCVCFFFLYLFFYLHSSLPEDPAGLSLFLEMWDEDEESVASLFLHNKLFKKFHKKSVYVLKRTSNYAHDLFCGVFACVERTTRSFLVEWLCPCQRLLQMALLVNLSCKSVLESLT